jgi:hypothetical protein
MPLADAQLSEPPALLPEANTAARMTIPNMPPSALKALLVLGARPTSATGA